MPDLSFGQCLKAYRISQSLTQAALAERVGCAVESIRKMEANKQRPSHAFATRLADMLAIPDQDRHSFITLARAIFTPAQIDQPASGPPRLPPQATPLIGRGEQSDQACGLLRQPTVRLLTITGPGGIGKTRLALHIASQLAGDFAAGVVFVPLESLTDPAQIAAPIAQALQMQGIGPKYVIKHLKTYLRSAHLLLVLDNFEHLQSAAPLIGDLLDGSINLKIIVTSRTLLRLAAEQAFPLPPLAVPDLKQLPPADQLLSYAAIQLFVQRTQAVKPDFTLDAGNAATIAMICCRLEGLPLAIELAAARMRLLSAATILGYLQQRLALLAGGPLDAPLRHQTLYRSIEWSYDLLAAPDQAVLRRLAVFADGCSLAAAQAVCGSSAAGEPAPDAQLLPPILDQLTLLADQSLLRSVPGRDHTQRFTLLEMIRDYAAEQLQRSGELAAARDRHLAFYLALAEQVAPDLASFNKRAQLERLAWERANLRAAIEWGLDRHNGEAVIRLCAGLETFWYVSGDPAELHRWLTTLLGQDQPDSVRANALGMLGYVLAFMQSDYAQGRRCYLEAVDLWRRLADQTRLTDGLARLGEIAMEQGWYAEAHGWYAEALLLRQASGDHEGVIGLQDCVGLVLLRQGEFARARSGFAENLRWWQRRKQPRAVAFALNALGMIALYEGRWVDAQHFHERAIVVWRESGDTRGVSSALNALGPALLYQGQLGPARLCLSASLRLRWEFHDYDGIAWNLERLGEVALAEGRPGHAARLWGRAAALRDELGIPLFPAERLRLAPIMAGAEARLAPADWLRSWTLGTDQVLAEVVAGELAGASTGSSG
ncbi:MAG: tetratricopeptide repeat protein [Herpetosiphonaceae bacterium]|nr:tetratricopeptide repeat protein [Herpetosiphonaceae bacterium]